MKRYFIVVKGIVQGVGFRPFIYKLALEFKLSGFVNNNSEGVYIDVEGHKENISNFIRDISIKLPPLAKIYEINITEKKVVNYSTFSIESSIEDENNFTLISPDVAICSKCIDDIRNIKSEKYKYAFANCTNCGPRFSIIKNLPYDRKNTTMSVFNMCSKCEDEYLNIMDRRFHAEPNSCINCGPQIFLTNNLGEKIYSDSVIEVTVEKILEGKILCIKGIGGFHLACDAFNYDVIKKLRDRKHRPDQPFAVMMKNINIVKKYCHVDKREEEILTGNKKPIVILNKKNSYDINRSLPDIIAPFQNTLGVMLPYTPLQELLFEEGLEVLIMTSGNAHGLPLEHKNIEAIDNLSNVTDYFLMNNRDIHIAVDDSIVKVIENEEYMLRRARGYVPESIRGNVNHSILACGSSMKNTFCISKENHLFLSQHNGDLSTLENYKRYVENIEHFKSIFKFFPKYVACDLHPDYYTNIYIEEQNIKVIKIQHHHAHIASCMAENNIRNKVIGIAFDGTGFGTDDKIWGGEFLICDLLGFERFAHLEYVKMPGGEKAIKEPFRMAMAYIFKAYENGVYSEKDALNIGSELYGEKAEVIWNIMKSNLNSPETSSMGRFFDGISSLIGVRDYITYEAEAAIELENKIYSQQDLDIEGSPYSYEIVKSNKCYHISFSKGVKEILEDRFSKVDIGLISLKIHNTIAEITIDICNLIRERYKINEVALSGGVFQNTYLLTKITHTLSSENFKVYTQKKIPTNDGGLALGQLIIASGLIEQSLEIK
ncbi:carbamoyltransferase HypF [Clostridium sp.]|uniref:carbamoyltransferase HypF n=1 Tax=Clostridium sp. TaxID=1506 RepID=UPI003D6D60BE